MPQPRNAEAESARPLPKPAPPSAALLAAVDAIARERFGAADLQGPALQAAVARVSEDYTRQRGRIEATRGADGPLCARLRFFLPRDLPKVQWPLWELLRAGALVPGEKLRILDLGAGLGTSSLGAIELLATAGLCSRFEVVAVDIDARALELNAALSRRYARERGLELSLETRTADLESFLQRQRGHYDLVLLGLLLNESTTGAGGEEASARAQALLGSCVSRLDEGGAVVVLEPALRETSRALQQVAEHLRHSQGPAHVFAPCLGTGACPMLERARDYCHARLPLALPDAIAEVARGAGLRDSDLTFSYLTLRSSPGGPLGPGHQGRGYRVISGPLRSKGKLELLLCGPGPARQLRRLDRHRPRGADGLADLGRGALVRVTAPADGVRLDVGGGASALEVVYDGAGGLPAAACDT
ncbi:MAG: methyltransferase domain-containing protein [Myxococcales bacterium]|nr:methyltransferase domain-containing protein [Myxococcales bacterium]